MSEANLVKRQDIIQTIMETPALRISSLDMVRDKFISNYNACNPDKQGELMYHRQMVHFNQIIAGSGALQNCDRFSLYAAFVTAAANGYSLDPADNTVYLVPKGGKAVLWRQAGAHVHRLIRSNQIRHAEQVQLVYRGDIFKVMGSKVLEHIQNFGSDEFFAGYQEFVLPDGQSRFFIYRQSNWEEWRSKSDVPNGENWNYKGSGRPKEGFLKTKITKHACTEKVWATGMNPIAPDHFQDIEVETDEDLTPNMGDYSAPTGPVDTPHRDDVPTLRAGVTTPGIPRPDGLRRADAPPTDADNFTGKPDQGSGTKAIPKDEENDYSF